MQITFEHLHTFPGFGARPGFCHRGARALCERYGLDWAEIVRAGGVDESVLYNTGDALALMLIEHAHRCYLRPLAGDGLGVRNHGR